ncbi:hypothetical protein MLD38_013830 [Melastoma candidum]|uniref:Uncharacterized protein n=1 Tax=Melastoma candidum TaxID=119954 RepID=A0ACB9RAT3_9MYRT|nr:hypothetical protein MLD38_013830 [Melastoma candidum]
MGNCCSGETRSGPTVKLILPDGQLKEFKCPVTTPRVLEESPGCFVCDSDEMEFGSLVSEVDGDEELRPGQLYFVLPKVLLNRPIRPAEMASLAVKASVALDMGRGGVMCSCIGRSKINPLMALTPYDKEMGNEHISVECASNSFKDGSGERTGGCHGNISVQRRSVGMGRASFSSNLSIIQEEFD